MNELSNPSQVIERNLAEFCDAADNRVLLVNAPDDRAQALFADQTQAADGWLLNFNSTVTWPNGHFSDTPPEGQWDHIIIYLPKAKERLWYFLSLLAARLNTNGSIWLVGENKGGIKSVEKPLKKHFSDIRKVDNARHCVLLELGQASHSISFETNRLSCASHLHQFQFDVMPGVFSQKKLDKGTDLLLNCLPKLNPRAVIDFGVGCGVISIWAAKQWPNSIIDGVEVDAMAIANAHHNMSQEGLSFDRLTPNNQLSGNRKYDLIISNPPFHQGINTHYQATEQFLSMAKQFLTSRGRLIIVANSFLKYEGILQGHFGQVQVLKEENGFKVIQALP